MVEFAFSMHAVLEQLNADSFQNFQLRIGLSLGPLVAGVIGAQKPQYDIWGNTVNMASRMDSHGETKKIHVRTKLRGSWFRHEIEISVFLAILSFYFLRTRNSLFQMTGEMARALPHNVYFPQSRGEIRVKGVREPMETFFLPLNSKRNSTQVVIQPGSNF